MQYVSDLITMITRQPTCWDGQVRTAQVTVPVATLGRELKRIIAEKEYLLQQVQHHQLIWQRIKYEDFKDDVRPVEDLLFWLIGERRRLTTKLVKQNPDSLRARVVNYQDLVAAVHQLRLRHLLIDKD